MTSAAQPIEILFSFDTTGSMYPCLTQVRQKIKETARRLFKDIPGLRIGIIAHGDYCDARETYVTSILDLTSDPETVSAFVEGVRPTYGGDAQERGPVPGVRRSRDAGARLAHGAHPAGFSRQVRGLRPEHVGQPEARGRDAVPVRGGCKPVEAGKQQRIFPRN